MTKNKMPNRYWGSQERPATKAEFFNAITAPALTGVGDVATIRMYGPIDSWGGYWGISTKDIGQVLDALSDSVTQIILRINSPGGMCFEAISILNMLRAHRATVTAVVDGIAASAASVIASGCDETVMSPGTQMMIHSPSVISWGNSRDLRKEADILDGIEASLVEIYTAKAGEQQWAQLLADETWLTATDAVELGLADRVAVIPDAGETETVGEDELLLVTTDDDYDDSVGPRVIQLHGLAAAAVLNKLPSSTEPGGPNREEDAVAYSDLKAGLQKRLGVTDADASDDTLLAAVDEALAEQPTNTPVPDGVVQLDATAYAELRDQAASGARAREEQVNAQRDRVIADAMRDGRITAASRQEWRDALDANEESTTKILAKLTKNTIPVTETGHSDDATSADDALYARAFGDDKKKED